MHKYLLYFVFFLCSISAVDAQNPFAGGTGTAGDPYQITTAEHLDSLRNYCWSSYTSYHFRLMNDIDLKPYIDSNYPVGGWRPIDSIDNCGYHGFPGEFHGGGHVISGLRIGLKGGGACLNDFAGLFGSTTRDCVIDSLGLIVDTIEGESLVGGLVALNEGVINSCYVACGVIKDAGVVINATIGGLVAANARGTISNCYSMVTVENAPTSGGFVGSANNGIENCYSIGHVDGQMNTGGFVGYTGGNPNFLNCYFDTITSKQQNGIGNNVTNTDIGAKPTTEMMQQATYTGWDFTNVWKIVDGCTYPLLQWQPDPDVSACMCGYQGSGTETDPYLITDAKELDCLRNYCDMGDTYKDLHFRIMNDIDLSAFINTHYVAKGWLPIGNTGDTVFAPFRPKLHGGGHTISGLRIDRDTVRFVGLFVSCGVDGLIDSLILKDVDIAGGYMTGGICAMNGGGIEKCHVSGTIQGENRVGGICGENASCVSYCTNESDVKGEGPVGGIVGATSGGSVNPAATEGIYYCCNTGTIEGREAVGGIIGSCWYINNTNAVYACCNLGDIVADSIGGGIVGSNMGKIRCCFNVGKISSSTSNMIGGVVGHNPNYAAIAQGIVETSFFDKEVSGLTNGIGLDNNNQEPNIEAKTNAEMQQMHTFPNSCWTYNGSSWEIDRNCIYPYFEPQTELISNCSTPPLTVTLSAVSNEICNGVNGVGNKGVVINEIMANPSLYNSSIAGCPLHNPPYWDTTTQCYGEWIELYNPDKYNPVDISCWYLGSAARDAVIHSQGYIFPSGSMVPAQGYVVIRGRRAPAVPDSLLVANGGKVLEIVMDESSEVCYGRGSRFWMANTGGWMALYNDQGIPQDAIQWGTILYGYTDSIGCNPNPTGPCGYSGTLMSFNDIPADKKTVVTAAQASSGLSFGRKIDGGSWNYNKPAPPTYGTSNDTVSVYKKTCNGKVIAAIAGGVPPYTIEWNDLGAQTTATAIDLCGGRYCVTITDADNNTVTECIDVLNKEPVLSVTASDTSFCSGDTVVLNTTAAGDASPFAYLWQGPDSFVSTAKDTIIANAATVNSGQYYITVSDTNNCSKTDTINVMINTTKLLEISGQTSYCEGDDVKLFLVDQTNITNIQWQLPDVSTSSNDTLAIPNSTTLNTGQYIVSATSMGSCGVIPDTVNVTISVHPLVNFGADTTACDSVRIGSVATPPVQYLWNTGDTIPMITVYSTGQYWLRVTSNGCTVTDTINATINTTKLLEIAGQISYCEGDDIKLFLTDQTNITNIQWQLPDGSTVSNDTLAIPNSTTLNTGKYIVSATSMGSCGVIPDTVNVTINALPVVNLDADINTCGDTLLTMPNGLYQYRWSTGDTTQTITVDTTGEYWGMVTENGCSSTDTIHVEINTPPILQIVQNGSLCENQSTELLVNTTASNILWNTGDTSTQIQVSQAGWYWVEASNGICVGRDTIEVNYTTTPDLQLIKDGDLCEGGSIFIRATTNGQSVVWNTGDTISQIQVNTPGEYWIETRNAGCVNRDTIIIEMSAGSELQILQEGDFCYTDNVFLTAQTTESNVVWNTGETSSRINISKPGTYSVVVTDLNNCKSKKEIQIEKNIPQLNLEQIGNLCQSGTMYLSVETDADQIVWNSGQIGNVIMVETSGKYTVTASTGNCVVTETVEIYCDCELVFPNAFNPDGALNTNFGPTENSQVKAFKMYIYDRWGKMLFETNSIDNGWNGKVEGKTVPQGAYVYIAYYLCEGDTAFKEKRGSVLLVR